MGDARDVADFQRSEMTSFNHFFNYIKHARVPLIRTSNTKGHRERERQCILNYMYLIPI